ncbi:putative aryl-alcohol dehydrogenase [Saccharomycopsis crataegensis]|uniref:Aryl-alcohol dehydrogenase n=1 Tax=Saccharomycopsis crataegensis TaxID=43959 RepID=A0AAV5QG74_9ASCO|nr:putative aryl-alcohol dehydrogenase [Saccharomycopsis crataegensis]
MSVENYTTLGESGLSISKIIVGCMSFGSSQWMDWIIEDEDKVMEILYKCYQSGLTTFDTADVYSNGLSEKLLGKFIKKYNIPRGEIVILTKCFFPTDPQNLSLKVGPTTRTFHLNNGGLSRKHIIQAARDSVERLGTYIDVLQIHRIDKTPKREIMKALNDVVDEGLARYIGGSAMKAFEFVELQALAESNGWHKFISMQNYYNLLYREQEREMIPFCQDNTTLGKVACIPYSPLARGLLGKPVKSETSTRSRSDGHKKAGQLYFTEGEGADIEIINRVEEIARKRGVSMANVSIAWVLSKGCFPIIGFNSVERVEDAVNSFSLELTKDEIEYLEKPYVPKPSVT